jgi:hypothetical protein
MTRRPVKAEYSYTGGLWAGPNSPEAISVLAIPGLVTCLSAQLAAEAGRLCARAQPEEGPGDAVGCRSARCFPVHLRTSALKPCRRAGHRGAAHGM